MQQYPTSRINERAYSFTTSIGCVYHCYFFDFSTSFSDYPELAPLVFGFNLELKSMPEGLAVVPPDKRIAYTVTTILKTFLAEKKNVVVYICDNSDNREKPGFINLPTGSENIMMVLSSRSKALFAPTIPTSLMPC